MCRLDRIVLLLCISLLLGSCISFAYSESGTPASERIHKKALFGDLGEVKLPRGIKADVPNVKSNSKDFMFQNAKALSIEEKTFKFDSSESDEKFNRGHKDGVWYVSYKQYVGGIPVVGSSVRMIVKDSKFVSAVSETYEDIDVSTEPSLSADDAVSSAKSGIGLAGVDARSAELVIFPMYSGNDVEYHLAWKIDFPFVPEPLGAWTAYVDAHDGEVLYSDDNVKYAHVDGHVAAMVYPQNPGQGSSVADMANLNVTALAFGSVLTDSAGMYNISDVPGNVTISSYLSGPYVRVLNEDAAASLHVANVSAPGTYGWNWNGTDSSDRDEESNVYYHVNRVHDFFTAGDPFDIDAMDYQMLAYVEVGDNYCNAYYVLSGAGQGNVYLGSGHSGCGNLALESDIIYHEYTHGVTHHIYDYLPYSGETGAMDEGFSDYFAATLTDDPVLGGWVISGGIRNLDNNVQKPTSWNEVHTDSLAFSGALWDLREALGASMADNLIIRAEKAEPHSFGEMLDFVLVIDDDNANLGDGTPNSADICEAFGKHRIISANCNASLERYALNASVQYSWVDAKANGQMVSASESDKGVAGMDDDDITSAIPLGFSFPFYGKMYDEVFIGSNGVILLEDYNIDLFSLYSMPSETMPNTIIAPLMADLNPGTYYSGGGDVYYWRDTAAQRFVVEWNQVHVFIGNTGTTNDNTLEAVLYSDGRILFQYQSMVDNTVSGVVGVENDDGTSGVTFIGASELDNAEPYALLFRPANIGPTIAARYPAADTVDIAEPSSQVFNITYSDPDDGHIAISWYENGSLAASNVSQYVFAGDYSAAGLYNISVSVEDFYDSDSSNWLLIVNNTNRQPNITDFEPHNDSVMIVEPANQTFTIAYEEPDEDSVNITWSLNASTVEQNQTEYIFEGNYSTSGSYTVTVVLDDGEAQDSRSWLMDINEENAPPQIDYSYPENSTVHIDEPANQTFNVTYSDPENDTLSIAWYLDGGLAASDVDNFTFNGNLSSSGTYNITATVSDNTSSTDMEWSLIVEETCDSVVDNQTLTSNTTLCAGQVYDLTYGLIIGAGNIHVDCNGAMLNGTGNSSGFLVDSFDNVSISGCNITNFLFGVHARNASGVVVNESNIFGNSGYDLYNDNVFNVSAESVFWGDSNLSYVQASVFDIEDNSSLGAVDYLPYLVGAYPSVLSADEDDDGYVAISYGGTDCNDSANTTYPGASELDDGVDQNCVNDAPVIHNISNVTVNESALVTLPVNATDTDGDVLSYVYSSPLNISGQWQTNYSDNGTYHVNVTVSDGGYNVSANATIIVLDKNQPPIVEPIANITVNETDIVTIHVNASDPEGANLTYHINDTRFVHNGSNFTWTTGASDLGTHVLNISVSDGIDNTSILAYVIVLDADLEGPNMTNISISNGQRLLSASVWMNLTTDEAANCTLGYALCGSGVCPGLSYSSMSETGALSHKQQLAGLSETFGNDTYRVSVICADARNNSVMLNRTLYVDTSAPRMQYSVTGTSKASPALQNSTLLNLTLQDATNVSSARYILDNVTYTLNIGLPMQSFNGSVLINLTYAGTHNLTVSANDTYGRANLSSVLLYSAQPTSMSSLVAGIESASGVENVSVVMDGVDVSSQSAQIVNGTNCSVSLRTNASGYIMTTRLLGFNALDARWDSTASSRLTPVFSNSNINSTIFSNNLTMRALVSFENNLSSFMADEAYNATLSFNDTLLAYHFVYYCSDNTGSSCSQISACSPSFAGTACYIDSGTLTTVYLPHFSAVAVAYDNILANVDISAPDTLETTGQNLSLHVRVYERSYGNYSLDGGAFSNISLREVRESDGRTDLRVNLAGTEPTGILSNGRHNLTINIWDLFGNKRSFAYNFTVNDTSVPDVTDIDSDSSGDEIVTVTLSVETDEISKCRYSTIDAAFGDMNDIDGNWNDGHSRSFDFTYDTSGTFYVRCIDVHDNVMNISASSAFVVDVAGEVPAPTGGGGGITPTTPPLVTPTPAPTVPVVQVPAPTTAPEVGAFTLFDHIPPGEEQVFEIDSADIALTKVSFSLGISYDNFELNINRMAESEMIVRLEDTYQYFSIETSEVTSIDVKTVNIEFRVKKDWFNKMGVGEVTLKKFMRGAWTRMDAVMLREDADYKYFAAETGDFSLYAVTFEKAAVAETRPAALEQPGVTAEQRAAARGEGADGVPATGAALQGNESLTEGGLEAQEKKPLSTIVIMFIVVAFLFVIVSTLFYFVVVKKGKFALMKNIHLRLRLPRLAHARRYRRAVRGKRRRSAGVRKKANGIGGPGKLTQAVKTQTGIELEQKSDVLKIFR